MTDQSVKNNVVELPTNKILTFEEAVAIAERDNYQHGLILLERPDGTMKCIEIGDITFKDIIFLIENLRNFAMEEFCASMAEDEESEEEC